MLLHPRRSGPLIGIILMCAILGATLLVPPVGAITLNFKLGVVVKGEAVEYGNIALKFPQLVSFGVNNSIAGSTYFWQFGDGTNSTSAAPSHTYDNPCVYDVQVRMTMSNGTVASGELVFGAFGPVGPVGRALAVCPPRGTAGFASVELAGGYYPKGKPVTVLVNGTSIGTVTPNNSAGDWVLDVGGSLTPEPNGTVYPFTTSPPTVEATFTTLEGIRASPSSGAPGTSVQIQGNSYQADSPVAVYLGGASLGTAETDSSGSFVMQVTIPFTTPLIVAGTYAYTTLPLIQGSQANFKSSGAAGTLLSSWWWWLLLIIIVIVVAYLVRRRMRRRAMASGATRPTQAGLAKAALRFGH